MTISSSTRKAGPYVGNGAAVTFAFAFKIFAAAELFVLRTNTANGTDTLLTLSADYTVTLNPDQNANPGGSITLTSGALAVGFNITITSDLEYLQPTDLTNQGGFYPSVITNSLDRLTILTQQLKLQTDSSLRLPISASPSISTALPLPQFGRALAWNGAGTALENVPLPVPVAVSGPEVFAESFGAVGDAVAEDQNAFNAAIAVIKVMGGGVLKGVPGKRYLINGIVRLCDNLTIDMTGCTVLIGPWFGARPLGQKTGVFVTTDLNAFTDVNNVAVASRNLTVIGGTYDGQNAGSAGVSLPAAQSQCAVFMLGAWGDAGLGVAKSVDGKSFTKARFHGATFTRFCGDGIRAYHGYDFTVDNCYGVDMLSDVTLSAGSLAQFCGSRNIAYGTNKHYNVTTALGWHGATFVDWERPIEALSFSRNISEGLNNGDGVSCEANNAVIRNVRWGSFVNNIVVNCNGNGIGVDGCSHVVVQGNAIQDVIIGVLATNSPYAAIVGNYLQDCQGNAILGGSNKALSIVGNVINGVTYINSTFQGEAINVASATSPDSGSQIIGNFSLNTDGGFCYDASNSLCADNTVINAVRSNSPTRKYVIRTDGVRSNVHHNNISQGVGGSPNFAAAAIYVDDTVAVEKNIITGTFTSGKYFIGGHNGVAVNLGLNADNFVHDFDTKNYTFVASSAPVGSYFRPGDRFYFAAPTNGGFIGQVWTTANAWRDFGAIA